jgi:hypothetical protein
MEFFERSEGRYQGILSVISRHILVSGLCTYVRNLWTTTLSPSDPGGHGVAKYVVTRYTLKLKDRMTAHLGFSLLISHC